MIESNLVSERLVNESVLFTDSALLNNTALSDISLLSEITSRLDLLLVTLTVFYLGKLLFEYLLPSYPDALPNFEKRSLLNQRVRHRVA